MVVPLLKFVVFVLVPAPVPVGVWACTCVRLSPGVHGCMCLPACTHARVLPATMVALANRMGWCVVAVAAVADI
eukprot:15457839-Alexandrium_andersonii.AAC.1